MQPRLVSLLLAIAACATSACGGQPAPVEPQAAAQDETNGSEDHDATCHAHVLRYREILAGASGRCVTDDDCVRYGGFDAEAVCGGLTDRETGRALETVIEASRADRCMVPGYSCPALEVRCSDGACR